MNAPLQRYGQAGQDDPVLASAPPGELGAVHDRRVHRRHLAATMIDLAARGRLSLVDAGNDPNAGYALDWYLLLPGEQAPVGVDAVDPAAVATAHPTPAPPAAWSAASSARDLEQLADPALRLHERALLDVVAATSSRLLSRVRAAPAMRGVLSALTDDVVERGWLRDWPGPALRTGAGQAVAADLRVARAHLDERVGTAQLTAALLAPAVALGLEALWTARLGHQRPGPPTWFTPGEHRTARGWLGVCGAAAAMAAAPPPGGGAGSAYSSSPPVGPMG